ncbi:hypothetical protein ACHAW5_001363 [Stephanodiscus triporus]|uniref:Uncharacterized protein n=1 Tax=Stephanodiscus triporus TaxID=2934178 RepID=A0ABD3P3U6_9STRA
MASLLLRTDPWIESTFLYASSFDPETFQEHHDVDDDVVVGRVGRGGREGGGGAGEEEEEEEEGRTEDTVPPGLLSSQRRWRASSSLDANDQVVPPPPAHPPSRRGKFVQVICSGGDADYYCRRTRGSRPDDDDDDDSPLPLPPHLVVHDGEYSAIAFLSPEACAALMMRDVDGGTSALAMPPRRSLIGVSRYTVSTVLRCCTRPPAAAATAAAATPPTPPPPPSLPSSADRGVDGEGGGEGGGGEGGEEEEEDDLDKTLPLPEDAQAEIDDAARRREIRAGLESHHRILSSLLFTDVPDHRRSSRRSSSRRSSAAAAAPSHPARRPPPASSSSSVARPHHRQLIPTELQRQLLMQVPDSRLCMCLYLQGPIANVGAENGGMIGDPVDVHCSVKLRRALMAHVRLYGGGGVDGGDDDDFDGRRDDGRPVPGRGEEEEEEEEEGYSHSVLIRRLEAVHCYYFWLDRRGRWMNNRTFGNDDDDAPSGENITPEWPWESRLIVDDLDRSSPPPFDERDNNSVVVVVVDPGEGGDRRTDAAAAIEGGGGGGGEGGAVMRENEHNIDDGASREVANVDAHEGGDPEAIGGRIGTDEPTAATAAAAARSRPRKYHGDVNELFLDFQDIDDVLGLDDLDFASASAAPPPENRDDAIRTHLEIDAARAADEDSGASAEDDDEDGNESDDLGGKEIDEGDDGPTFVGIDDMIVDDEDDSDEDEKGEGGDSDDDRISSRKIMDHARRERRMINQAEI